MARTDGAHVKFEHTEIDPDNFVPTCPYAWKPLSDIKVIFLECYINMGAYVYVCTLVVKCQRSNGLFVYL